jgi:magnesium chelatase family protein
VSVAGIDGEIVEVQADLSPGLPGLTFTGLPDKSVTEARDRIRAAVLNSGVAWPQRRITLALLPADVRKFGSRFDLALALAVLAAAKHVPERTLVDTVWIGELGLDGRLRPVRGVLPSVVAAARAGVRRIVVPAENAAEAALVESVEVRGAQSLLEILKWMRNEGPAPAVAVALDPVAQLADAVPDLADVAGQSAARRAMEVAAAGGHHISLQGAPGAGKTMLARRLPGLLPVLSVAQALEVTAIHSVAGTLPGGAPLLRWAPFQAPHHTTSVAALIGGGSGLARPGAISLAHHGVLFLDEASEQITAHDAEMFSPSAASCPIPTALPRTTGSADER